MDVPNPLFWLERPACVLSPGAVSGPARSHPQARGQDLLQAGSGIRVRWRSHKQSGGNDGIQNFQDARIPPLYSLE